MNFFSFQCSKFLHNKRLDQTKLKHRIPTLIRLLLLVFSSATTTESSFHLYLDRVQCRLLNQQRNCLCPMYKCHVAPICVHTTTNEAVQLQLFQNGYNVLPIEIYWFLDHHKAKYWCRHVYDQHPKRIIRKSGIFFFLTKKIQLYLCCEIFVGSTEQQT